MKWEPFKGEVYKNLFKNSHKQETDKYCHLATKQDCTLYITGTRDSLITCVLFILDQGSVKANSDDNDNIYNTHFEKQHVSIFTKVYSCEIFRHIVALSNT